MVPNPQIAASAGRVIPFPRRQAHASPETGVPHRPERALLTLVFTDIVASTEALEHLGDRAWCSLLLQHHGLVRDQLKVCKGREIDAAGDGFFLAFDRPSRAVRFAAAVMAASEEIGVVLRVGIHAGECEIVGKRVEGIAVHTAARVAGEASAGEILVTGTVRDLVAGSEHRFGRLELRELKGLAEPRQLCALEPAADDGALSWSSARVSS